jgi:hypothetical protein
MPRVTEKARETPISVVVSATKRLSSKHSKLRALLIQSCFPVRGYDTLQQFLNFTNTILTEVCYEVSSLHTLQNLNFDWQLCDLMEQHMSHLKFW